jgi:TonB-linked SusC/RagA family outer membrane protein
MKKNCYLGKKQFFQKACTVILLLIFYSVQVSANYSDLPQKDQNVMLQEKKITGKVRDNVNKPIPGVSVVVKGTTIGTITDENGDYSLSKVPENGILNFSFVGLKTQEIAVAGMQKIDLVMVEETVGLDEVVAVGYGTQQKRDVTGATSSVKATELVKRPIVRIEQALQGTTPGVQVVSASGNPGVGLTVKIRGASSITGGTEPLYVIDGYIGGDIGTLNPNDIETMDVLKDASATAIYGSRGSNGVVLITTKSGKEGKAVISFNSWVSSNSLPSGIDLMNAAEFATTVNTRTTNTIYSADQINQLKASGGTNWLNEVTRNPLVQNYDLSIAGGTPNVKYRVSYNRLDQPGMIINSSYLRSSLRANLDIKASNRLNFKFNFSYVEPKSRNNGAQGDITDAFASALTYDPTLPVRDASGNYNLSSQYANSSNNPVAVAYDNYADNSSKTTTGTGVLEYKIMDDLTFTSNNTYSVGSYFNQQFHGILTNKTSSNVQVDADRSVYYQNSNFLTYDKKFGEHHLTATVLYEQSKYEDASVTAKGTNLSTDEISYWNLSLGGTQTAGSNYSANQMQSYMARVNYSYKNKYLLTASLRRDGSSKLTEKYDNFPSAAVAWNVTEEDFMKNHPVITGLKVRASYGETGNQAIDSYSSIPKITIGGDRYFFNGTTATNATYLGPVVAKGLKWEHAKQTNVGVDLALYSGKITFTADYYNKDNVDLLYSFTAPLYVGGGNYNRNMGKLNNQGIEFSIGGVPVSKNDFTWTTNFTLSFNKNKVVDLMGSNDLPASGPGTFGSEVSRLRVGRPLGEFYGYKFLGTWKTSEAAQAAKYGAKPGDAKYADLNNDFTITPADRTVIGNGTPKYNIGFINDFKYKAFTLSVMIQGSGGNQIFSPFIGLTYGGSGFARDATNKAALNMWSPTKETNIPNIVGYAYRASDEWIYNGSYMRLKNVALTYSLPKSLINKAYINKMEVYVSGQNLVTITKYPGFDPEITSALGAQTPGIDTGVLPNPRSFTVGLRIDF